MLLYNNTTHKWINQSDGFVKTLQSSEADVLLPICTFTIGVVGNALAIAILISTIYKEETPSRLSMRSRNLSSRSETSVSAKSWTLPRVRENTLNFWRKLRRNTKALHVLILVLLTVNLLGNLATFPITLHLYLHNNSIMYLLGPGVCRYSAFAMMFSGLVMKAILTTLAIVCLHSIKNSFEFHRNLTVKKMFAIASSLLVFCGLFCSLPLILGCEPKQMHPNSWCFTNWRSEILREQMFNFVYGSIGILLIVTTMVCNGLSIAGLLISRRRFSDTSSRYHGRNEIKRDTVIQLSAVTVIYVVCWSPLVIRILVNQVSLMPDPEGDRRAIWMATVNPTIFPWVYIMLRRTFYNFLANAWNKIRCRTPAKTLPKASRRQESVVNVGLLPRDGAPPARLTGSVVTINTIVNLRASQESLYDNA